MTLIAFTAFDVFARVPGRLGAVRTVARDFLDLNDSQDLAAVLVAMAMHVIGKAGPGNTYDLGTDKPLAMRVGASIPNTGQVDIANGTYPWTKDAETLWGVIQKHEAATWGVAGNFARSAGPGLLNQPTVVGLCAFLKHFGGGLSIAAYKYMKPWMDRCPQGKLEMWAQAQAPAPFQAGTTTPGIFNFTAPAPAHFQAVAPTPGVFNVTSPAQETSQEQAPPSGETAPSEETAQEIETTATVTPAAASSDNTIGVFLLGAAIVAGVLGIVFMKG